MRIKVHVNPAGLALSEVLNNWALVAGLQFKKANTLRLLKFNVGQIRFNYSR